MGNISKRDYDHRKVDNIPFTKCLLYDKIRICLKVR